MTSKYLEKFRALAEEADQDFRLFGDFLIVERIHEKEKTTKSGIVMPATGLNPAKWDQTDLPVLCHVLYVGEGYYKDDGEEVPLAVEPGDIILIGQLSANWFKTFMSITEPGIIGITRESEIKAKITGKDGYAKVDGILGSDL